MEGFMKTYYTTDILNRWTRLSRMIRGFLVVPLSAGLVLALMMPAVAVSQLSTYTNPSPVPLGAASTFGALAGSAITGSATINGDIGAITAIDGTIHTNGGTIYGLNVSQVTDALTALATALTDANNHTSRPTDFTIPSDLLGGLTLYKGIYDGGALVLASGQTLKLDGSANDVFIIRASSTLDIKGGTVSLINDAVWSNVFWYVGSSATILSGSTFNGIILAITSITLNASAASVTAKLLAHGAAVTINSTVLPVELVSFTATANRTNAELHWSTATEVNNYGFDVERRLINSQSSTVSSWEKIGFVEGNGTSNAAQSYSYTDASVSSGTYVYRLKQIDNNGTYKYSSEAEITIAVPKVVALNQNYPNPFNPTTTITFTLAQDGFTTLKIYDILGREVTTLVNGEMKSGVVNTVNFNASKYSSGVYFSRLESSGNVQMKTLMLLK
jgi:hypothetical protein